MPLRPRSHSGTTGVAGPRIFRIILLFALCYPSISPVAWSQSDEPTEYQLKAAFLFKFAKFVDWPESSFSSPQSPFVVCVIGKDPFGPSLDESLRGKTIEDRNVEVARFPNVGAINSATAQACKISFVSASEQQHLREVIASFQKANTLLIGDAVGFAASGGAIEFVLEDGRIRFAINVDAVDRAGLKVNSRLLALATIVHDDSRKGKS
jgi:YfiR/HmsC-like